MGQNLLLVGSVPLRTVEDVMTILGGALGRYLPAIPDGEVGERRSWVLRLSYQIFNGHIDLDTIKRPARAADGREQLMPRDRGDVWLFQVKDGVDQVKFGNPGYRLGYARDAVADCAWEVSAVHNGHDPHDGFAGEHEIATHTGPIRRLSAKLPEQVALGFHFCFGTFGGWPRFVPPDLARTIELVNACVAAVPRRVDWVHIPTLDRSDDDFYKPLARLESQGARPYLGMIHSMQSFEKRLDVARKYLPDFGLAAYCGFGRNPPEDMPRTLDDHLTALRLAGLD
jgi:hypothetical protein